MKIRLTVPSWRSYLSGQNVSRIGVVTYFLIEEKYFHQNSNTFYTKHSSTHLLYPYIIFLWHTLYFSLHIMHMYYFWKEKIGMLLDEVN